MAKPSYLLPTILPLAHSALLEALDLVRHSSAMFSLSTELTDLSARDHLSCPVRLKQTNI